MDAISTRPDTPAQSWARALANIAPLRQQPTATLPRLLDGLAIRHPDLLALTSEQSSLTYADLADFKCRIARWAMHQGLGRHATVGLLMDGGPAYIATWLGLSQTGTVVALLNDGLRAAALAQAIACSRAGSLIVDAAHARLVHETLPLLPSAIRIFHTQPQGSGPAPDGATILNHWDFDGATVPEDACEPVHSSSTALLLFTSGTTGLPKAARISHYRVLEWGFWFAGMMNTQPADRLYNCLPLFHSTGGIAAIGGMLLNGGSVVLRPRFSATRFWDDVTDHRCTIFLYIGELCRYLTAQPPHPKETAHQLRLCCGNGLREDVWHHFQARFRIPRILEFYASTEGNVSLYNCEGKPGAIGRIPSILRHRFPVALIPCDPETGAIPRNPDGRCTRCRPGEIGEAIGLISAAGVTEPSGFEGYTDAEATERKILRDVFAPGDAWFRTGDLMRQDEAGYVFFVDRLGDTFRWKGENVSTTQVEDVLSAFPGVINAIVYGVAVEGEEGRAGMAAVSVSALFDIDDLPAFLADHLPPYARPLYLRICETVETTATFKPVKAALARDGADVARITDPLYRLDPRALCYRRLQSGVPA